MLTGFLTTRYGDYSQNAFPEDPFVEPAWKTSESEALAYELALRNKTPSPENRINYSEYFPEYPQDVQELAECEPRAHVPRDLFNPRDLTTDMY